MKLNRFFVGCIVLLTGTVFGQTPWRQTFTPLRVLPVSPTGIGGNALDFSGNGNTGAISVDPPSVAGKVTPPSGTGFALNFNGVSDYIALAAPVAPWGADATIEAWIKTTFTNANGCFAFPILGATATPSGCGVGQVFGIASGRIKFGVSEDAVSGNGDDYANAIGSFVADGNWHHVAVTIDQAANIVRLYKDGVFDAQGDISLIAKSGAGIAAITRIGRTAWYPTDYYFNGSLDELAVYNRVLTGAEIAAHYNNGTGHYGIPEAGLTAGWHFDEGPVGTPQNPLNLAAAARNAKAGDLYRLASGSYTGIFNLANHGTTNNPIVFKPAPDARATIVGVFNVTGSNTWVWGLEFTDPSNTATGSTTAAINLTAAGGHAINNVVHDMFDENGIGAWNGGPGQVVYGNLIYRIGTGNTNHPHCIYTQNDFPNFGYKYIINNVLLDQADPVSCPMGNCFNFHAYTEGGFITGYRIEQNISRNGRFLIGGFNVPADNEIVVGNYFYQSGPQFGYRRPTQVECRSNYVARGTIDTSWFWGAGEIQYTQTKPNIFTDNTVYRPASGNHVNFRTSAYLPAGRCEGCPAIEPTDVFDHNTYSAPFQASFFANNSNLGNVNFATWKTATASAGNAFDVNSLVVAAPTATEYVLLPNEYEPGRAHLAIYNWSLATNVFVDLSPVVSPGGTFRILDAKDPFGTPLATGTYTGPVSVPLGSAEFAALLVTSLPPSGYANWIATFYPSATGGVTGNDDHDDFVNGIEYAFGFNPTVSSPTATLPRPSLTGNDYAVSFVEPAGISGVVYGAEWSSNLVSWITIPDTGTTTNHIFTVNVTDQPRAFFRYKISVAP